MQNQNQNQQVNINSVRAHVNEVMAAFISETTSIQRTILGLRNDFNAAINMYENLLAQKDEKISALSETCASHLTRIKELEPKEEIKKEEITPKE